MNGASPNTVVTNRVHKGFSECGQRALLPSSCECGLHSPLPGKQYKDNSSVEMPEDPIPQMGSSLVELRVDPVSQMGSLLVEIHADPVPQMGSLLVEIHADPVPQMGSSLVVLAKPAPGQTDVSKPQQKLAEVVLPLGPWLTKSNTTQVTLNGSKLTPVHPTKTVSRSAKPKPCWVWGSEAGIYKRRDGTMYYKSATGVTEERGWME